MKALLSLLFLFVLNAAMAQKQGYARLPTDSASQKVMFTAVVAVNGASKDELFDRGKAWAVRSFGNSNVAARTDDKAAGQLVYRGTIAKAPTSALANNSGEYTLLLSLFLKDGRFKYVIDQITYADRLLGGGPKPVESWASYRQGRVVDGYTQDLEGKINVLVADLTAAMSNASIAEPGKKNW